MPRSISCRLNPQTRSLVWATACLAAFLAAPAAAQPGPPFQKAVIIDFDEPVMPNSQQALYRRLDEAQRQQADLILLRINSPGGRVDVTFEIAERLGDLTWARVVAWVPKGGEAISGAAVLAMACDETVLHSEARLGDVGGIVVAPDSPVRYVEEKVTSDLVQRMRILAQRKHRPAALLEAMVDRKVDVYRVRNRKTGEETWLTDAGIQGAATPEDWEKLRLVEETGGEKFLTVTGERAVELELARAVVADLAEVKALYGLEADPLPLRSTWVDTLVYYLNLPLITVLLFVAGLVFLYLELQMAGVAVFGLLSGMCFILFFWSRVLGGTADWLEVVLFAAGVAALMVELLVLPGFGVAGVAGGLLIIASLVMANQSRLIPESEEDYRELLSTLAVLGSSAGLFTVAAVAMTRWFGKLPLLNRIVLEPPAPAGPAAAAEIDLAHRGPLPGDQGRAISLLRPAGKARFGERNFDVVAEGDFIEPDTELIVERVAGNRIIVRRAGPTE